MAANYRALMLMKPGGPKALQIVELPVVAPGPGQLRVRVRAAGVGSTDLIVLAGKYRYAPKILLAPGYEVAGVVDAIGAGVTGFKVGDRVAALTVYGGFAKLIVREAEHFLPIPDDVSDRDAAAVILNYVTAWQMIYRGRGTNRLSGAATPGRRLRVRRGRRSQHWSVHRCAASGRDVGGIWFHGGFHNAFPAIHVRQYLHRARLRGRQGKFYGITMLYRKDPKPLREDLPKIFELLGPKKIDPLVHCTFPLLDARKALELLATGSVEGKIVLTYS